MYLYGMTIKTIRIVLFTSYRWRQTENELCLSVLLSLLPFSSCNQASRIELQCDGPIGSVHNNLQIL